MNHQQHEDVMHPYLESNHYIDWWQSDVLSTARLLARGLQNDEAIAQACFLFVRDDIKHSGDHHMNPVTCKASEVLTHKTGYCYAKSHLLAALLRANNIPAGLCYQRLTVNELSPPFCLHGLNAVYLQQHGWYRVDPRGNTQHISAEFSPPREQLAFTTDLCGEMDLPEIWASPLPVVTHALSSTIDCDSLAANLPDVLLMPSASR